MKVWKIVRMPVVAMAAVMCLPAMSATTTKTNFWIGASGGDWGDGENWSLGHKPADDEMAYFNHDGQALEIIVNEEYTVGTWRMPKASKNAPITFRGTGKVLHNGYHPSPYIYNNHPVTLDGVTFDIGNFESLWYSPVTITNGGSFITSKQVYLWNSSADLTIIGGSYKGGNLNWAANVSVLVKDGELSCKTMAMRDVDNSAGEKIYYKLDLTFDEGSDFRCEEDFSLIGESSLILKDSAMTVGGKITIDASASLDLVSGAITNASALTDKRLITENQGVSITVTETDNAVLLDNVTDGETLVFSAPFRVPNGRFSMTNRLTLVSEHPFEADRIYYAAGSTGSVAPLTLRLADLTVGEYSPFDTSTGNARTFYIDGPTVWYPSEESMTAKTSRTVYPQLDGELTVYTCDRYDPSLKRKLAICNLGSRDGNGALVVRGGGEFYMTHLYSYYPFRYVTVETGSTLELGPHQNSEFTALNAGKITLGAGSTLKIPGGKSCAAAMSWAIDPAAKIVVDIPADTPAGGLAILRDYSEKLHDCSAQVELTGEGAEGWQVFFAEGTLAAVKSVGAVDGTYAFEWTGGAGNGNWSEATNWYCNVAPEQHDKEKTHAFGAADAITESDFNISGAYIGQIFFRNSAIKTFTVTSAGERTFFLANTGGGVNSSIYSESAVPQHIAMRFRKTGAGSAFSYTAANGPIVIDSTVSYPAENAKLHCCGDIRVAGTLTWPQVSFYRKVTYSAPNNHLMVMPDAEMTVANQISPLSAGYTSFAVQKGGRLDFSASEGGFYRWTVRPGKNIIDGEMSVSIPFQGGVDQVYGGSGTLSLAKTEPYSAASSLMLQDSLTLELGDDWNTVTADADHPLTLAAASYSDPVLKLSSDWTYGPAAGTASATEASDRAAEIGREARLLVDAGGCTARFTDAVKGDGTLAVTNGVLELAGGVSESVTVELADSGFLKVAGDVSIGKLKSSGGALRISDGAVVTCSGDVDLDSMEFDFSSGVPSSWTTVLVSSGTITGSVSVRGLETRITTVDGVSTLQCRQDIGFKLILR